MSFCIWAAGRRTRWRVRGLIIKTAEIGLFVCDLKKLSFSSNGKRGRVEGEGEKGAHATPKKRGSREGGQGGFRG